MTTDYRIPTHVDDTTKIWLRVDKKTKKPTEKLWTRGIEATEIDLKTHSVGLLTGKISGTTVVDIDDMDAYEKIKPYVGNPAIVETGSGKLHLYYPYESGVKMGTKVVKIDGIHEKIDTRNDGSMVVAPPSIHPNGKPYKIIKECGDKMPTELRRLLTDHELIGNKIVKKCEKVKYVRAVENTLNDILSKTQSVIREVRGDTIILTNATSNRICCIGGEDNLTDNSYLIEKMDRYEYHCHDGECRGKVMLFYKPVIELKDFIAPIQWTSDVVAIKAPMGSGKSHQTVATLKELAREIGGDFTTLAISTKTTYTSQMITRLREAVPYEDYRDLKGNISMKSHKHVLIQAESIHRLFKEGACNLVMPDLLILDEVVSIFQQMFATTMKKKAECWSILRALMTGAKRILCLDAHLNNSVMEWVMSYRPTPIYSAVLYRKTMDTVINIYKDSGSVEYDLMNNIYSDLAKGKRVVIPMNYGVPKAEAMAEAIRRRFPTKVIRVYHKETSQTIKNEDFANPAEKWLNVDVLIYTPTLVIGVDYSLLTFHKVYAFFLNTTTDALGSAQMLLRVRHLIDKEINVAIKYIYHTGGPHNADDLEYDINNKTRQLMGDDFEYEIINNRKVYYNTDRFRHYTRYSADQHKSKSFFRILLTDVMNGNGYTVVEADWVKKKSPASDLKELLQEMDDNRADAISKANLMTQEQMEAYVSKIEQNALVQLDEMMNYYKTRLWTTYQTPLWNWDKEQVKHYRNSGTIATFKNLQQLYDGMGDIDEKVEQICHEQRRRVRRNPAYSYEIVNDANFLQHRYTISLMKGLGLDPDAIFTNERINCRMVTQASLADAVKSAHMITLMNDPALWKAFGKKTRRMTNAAKWDVKRMLEFVKPCLGMYGLGLKRMGTNVGCDYKLTFKYEATISVIGGDGVPSLKRFPINVEDVVDTTKTLVQSALVDKKRNTQCECVSLCDHRLCTYGDQCMLLGLKEQLAY